VRLRVSPDVILTEIGDGTGVLLHVGTKFYFTLNATGVAVWKTLAEASAAGAPVTTLADALHRRFEVDADVAARDLEPLLQELLAEDLDARVT
jgi:hypothetical protein